MCLVFGLYFPSTIQFIRGYCKQSFQTGLFLIDVIVYYIFVCGYMHFCVCGYRYVYAPVYVYVAVCVYMYACVCVAVCICVYVIRRDRQC